jgi:thiol:disulfide interchange protein
MEFQVKYQTPLFTTSFIVCTVVSAVQIGGIFEMRSLAGDGPLKNNEAAKIEG